MEIIKWVASAVVALAMTILGFALAIGAAIFITFMKVLGIITVIAVMLTSLVKEKIDERTNT